MSKATISSELSLAANICLELYAKYYGSGKWLGPVGVGENESRARLINALRHRG